MMRGKLWLLPALCLVLASCTKTTEKQKKIEVQVDPASLFFKAVGNAAQTVTVTANDEWNWSSSGDWITVEKVDAEALAVTVTDNLADEAREAKVTVFAKNDANVRAEITVQQNGAGELTFSVSPAKLQFAGENAEPQLITVDASAGLAWEATAEEGAAWIQVTKAEGQVSVTVEDNPEATERSGRVFVTSAIGQKAVMVTQAGKTVPMIYDLQPASLELRWDNMMIQGISFKVSAEVSDWSVRVEDANGNMAIDWLVANANKDAAEPLVEVFAIMPNENTEDRFAYVVIVPKEDADRSVRVEVCQKAKPTYFSTLAGNAALEPLTHAYVTLYPNSASDIFNFSRWNLLLWSDNVSYDPGFGSWTGTGDAVQIQIQADRILYDAATTTYLLPSMAYFPGAGVTLEDKNGSAGTYIKGGETLNYNFPAGSWLVRRANDAVTEAGPIVSGTITVSYEDDAYELTIECMDDNNHTITGTYRGTFGSLNIVPPMDDPSVGGGGDDVTPEV